MIASVVALFVTPLVPLFSAEGCGMAGVPIEQAKSCHGCCAKMKCCQEAKPDQTPQPAQSSNNRDESGLGAMVASQPMEATLLYTLPTGHEDFRLAAQSVQAPVFSSLSRLCIRLI